jgi:AhpD family alkylhydroperoxidase
MAFDDRTTDLIAIGASVAANCQSCVEYHTGKASEHGVESSDIAQAIEIGRMVRRGAAAKVDQVANGLLHTESSTAEGASSGGRAASEPGCCAAAFKDASGGSQGEVGSCFPNRCTPFSSMAAGWSSGGFPFRAPGDTKS